MNYDCKVQFILLGYSVKVIGSLLLFLKIHTFDIDSSNFKCFNELFIAYICLTEVCTVQDVCLLYVIKAKGIQNNVHLFNSKRQGSDSKQVKSDLMLGS